MRKILILIVILCFVFSCEKESKLEQEIAEIGVDFKTERFDRLFANITPETLPKLKETYPFMFSKRVNDSVWIARISDTLQQKLQAEVHNAFPDFNTAEDEIRMLFQHLKYYFKEFKEPRVITVTDYVDYRNKVIVTDSIVLIALDTYLGSGHEFYGDIQNYLKQNFEAPQIVVDLATQYSERQIFQSKRRTLLDEMVYYGKVLYFKDVMLPFKQEAERIGYTPQQLAWAQENESNIWRYFVEKELLYSTYAKLSGRFIAPAPFSKFNLELDSDSPGRLGQYIGWQIVRAYMKNNDVTLKQMLNTKAEEIFTNSKYKPRK